MKRWHRRSLVAGLFLLAGVLAASGEKYLLNTSFEDTETEKENNFNDLAAKWGRWGAWFNREEGWKPTAKGKCVMGYHHWQIEDEKDSGFYQDLPEFPAGKKVTFSIQAAKDPDTNAELVELRIEKTEGQGTVATATFPVKDLGGTFKKLSVTGETTQPGIRVLVRVKPAASGERKGALKFDDADLEVK